MTETIRDNTHPTQILEKHVYRYSNLSDPSARDQRFVLTFGYADQFTPYDEWSELGFKRGLLLNEEIYNGDGKKVKGIGYKYRKDNYLKDYVLSSNLIYECYGNSAQYYHFLGGIYKLYYPKYDMIEKQDTIFNLDGSGKMATTHTYNKSDIRFTSWHPYKHQVDMRIVNSEILTRGMFSEKNTYVFGNFNASSGNDSILYKGYSYIKPYKTIYEWNGQLISEESTAYSPFNINGKSRLLPKMITSRNCYNITDTLVNYSQYTSTGMPSIYKEKGKPTTFLKWGLNDCYLMIVSNYDIPISISPSLFFEQKSCLSYMSSFVYNKSSGQFTGYVWDPLFGPTAIIGPNGNVNTFQYDRFGRLASVYDYNNVLLREYQYNYRK